MTKSEYEKIIELFNKITLEQRDFTSINKYFGKKGVSIGENTVSVASYLATLAQYKEYENVPELLISHNKIAGDYADNILSGLISIDGLSGDKENITHNVAASNIDNQFLLRMKKELDEARKVSRINSRKFDALYDTLEETIKYVDGSLNISPFGYSEQLKKLEKAANAYLDHKVESGINKRASGKVKAACAIKQFIKERDDEVLGEMRNPTSPVFAESYTDSLLMRERQIAEGLREAEPINDFEDLSQLGRAYSLLSNYVKEEKEIEDKDKIVNGLNNNAWKYVGGSDLAIKDEIVEAETPVWEDNEFDLEINGEILDGNDKVDQNKQEFTIFSTTDEFKERTKQLEEAIEEKEKLLEKGFDKGNPNYYNLIRETTFKYIANKIALEEHNLLGGKVVKEETKAEFDKAAMRPTQLAIQFLLDFDLTNLYKDAFSVYSNKPKPEELYKLYIDKYGHVINLSVGEAKEEVAAEVKQPEVAKESKISETKIYAEIKEIMDASNANCRKIVNDRKDGKLDASAIATYIFNTTILKKLDVLGDRKNTEENKEELEGLKKMVNNEAEVNKIKRSPALATVVEKCQNVENLSERLNEVVMAYNLENFKLIRDGYDLEGNKVEEEKVENTADASKSVDDMDKRFEEIHASMHK